MVQYVKSRIYFTKQAIYHKITTNDEHTKVEYNKTRYEFKSKTDQLRWYVSKEYETFYNMPYHLILPYHSQKYSTSPFIDSSSLLVTVRTSNWMTDFSFDIK